MPSTCDVAAQIRHANATGRIPVVFVGGPWLRPSSWERWAQVFAEAGFAPITPDTTAGTVAARIAGHIKGLIADHIAGLIAGLERKPAVVGHSTGALLAQVLAGRGLASTAVAISPAPFREAPPPEPAVALTYDRFRRAFANTTGEEEARRLYETFVTPAPQAPPHELNATAHDRGPLLFISGELDRTAPWAVAHAAYEVQARNAHHLTEIVELPGRAHSLTIDNGWREVCGTALTFIQRFADP
jgi:pimeloyl-ACP methyl ester carboxylesterase